MQSFDAVIVQDRFSRHRLLVGDLQQVNLGMSGETLVIAGDMLSLCPGASLAQGKAV